MLLNLSIDSMKFDVMKAETAGIFVINSPALAAFLDAGVPIGDAITTA
jgi:hypothetical protein